MLTQKTLEQLLKEKLISQQTYDKVVLSKQYIERKYNFKMHKNKEMKNFIEKLNICGANENKINQIKKEIYEKEMVSYRKGREKLTIRNYESISIIGIGAFGEVHVCREIKTRDIVAIKKIKKDIVILKNQIIHIRNEQYFMSNVKSPWIVDLKASFQEDDYLYLVMEYCPGGDLMNLLIKRDILTEKEAKFYLAELILSIESIHKMDCIHRDIKPDNILIDKNGHIKLSDFGLAKISEKIFENKQDPVSNKLYHHNKNYSCVGTAYYVAPEVLSKQGYGPEIDWWSAGIIFYEMLFGYAPFCSKETSEVCYKVLNWKKYFKFPSKPKISPEALDLIIKLINNSNKRLGKNGASEIKKHQFFEDIDWDNIRNLQPPFIPKLENEYDTKYFETFEVNESFYPTPSKNIKRKDIEYLGYTYKEDNDLFIEHKKFEKEIFNNIKKIINTEENKTSNTNYSSLYSGILSSNQNIKAYSKNCSNRKNKLKLRNKSFFKSERNAKESKINIIQLPKRKSKMNSNKNEITNSIITINRTNIPSKIKNPKIKLNLGEMKKKKKKIKRISPSPKYNLIVKALNLSKNKIIKNCKSKSNHRYKSQKYSNNNTVYSNNTQNNSSFNYNCYLLKKLLKKSINKNNNKNEMIKEKQINNIKIMKNVHNNSYNIINKKINVIQKRDNAKKIN